MKLAILLHIHQPPTQDAAVTQEIAQESYIPLIKTIRQKKNIKVTLNMTLSFLEQMELTGNSEWISDVKKLVDEGKIELVGTGAFHPLLSRLPRQFIEKQIILNEYSLGYFFGRTKGFEGEPSVLIKDLNGFHPPEVAVNELLIETLSSLGYNWTIVDEIAVTVDGNAAPRYGVYKLKDYRTLLACRNRDLSNLLSFKRDLETHDFIELLQESGDSLIDLDGEFFGHHHKEGIYLLDLLFEDLRKANVEVVSATDFVDSQDLRKIDVINESTWGTREDELAKGILYPKWDLPDNEIHKLLWEIHNALVSIYKDKMDGKTLNGHENIPVWKSEELEKVEDQEVVNHLKHDLVFHKSLHSDQFWWASQVPLYNHHMIERALDLYAQVGVYLNDEAFNALLKNNKEKIKPLIEEARNASEPV